jgi:hypothetical protein
MVMPLRVTPILHVAYGMGTPIRMGAFPFMETRLPWSIPSNEFSRHQLNGVSLRKLVDEKFKEIPYGN